jgi:hypothetical protein
VIRGDDVQGPHAVEVAVIASSNACMYSFQLARSATSDALNFHSLPGVSRRAMNLRFCSSFDTWRKNFTILVPLRSRWRSNALMSS